MLYTKTGDTGFTDLLHGKRVQKNDDIIELIGTIDEFSASLGISSLYVSETVKQEIFKLQNQLVSVMAELAGGKKYVTHKLISEIETAIDSYPEFNGFVTACGNPEYVYLNMSRCIIRRAERIAVRIKSSISEEMLSYLNRLSDLIYAMSISK